VHTPTIKVEVETQNEVDDELEDEPVHTIITVNCIYTIYKYYKYFTEINRLTHL